ncbi:MAG: hypothetical protein ACW98X_21485 [Promethearchaeota archaeon]|jgi:hypothetical protein
MKAKIIAKDYDVTTYTLNGRVRRIVELLPVALRSTPNDHMVFKTINSTGSHNWDIIYNQLDKQYPNGMPSALENSIDRHTV